MQPQTTEFLQGTWTVGGVTYRDSIACEDCGTGPSAVYHTAGRYRRLVGTLVTDSLYEADLDVQIYGQNAVHRKAVYGHPVAFDIDVSGAEWVTITVHTGNSRELVVLGQARLES